MHHDIPHPRRFRRPHGHRAFSLVELLVVIGVIGLLVGLLIPAVQASRETAKRNACGNNLRQLGIAALHHESAHGYFPSGAMSREFAAESFTPWTFYRWSALAQLTPYMENTAVYDALDFSFPLYGASFQVRPENADAIRLVIPEFLCPSEELRTVSEIFGPTNYAASAGSGNNGGSPRVADGVFYINSDTRVSQITDGTSKTALMSESVLGDPKQSEHDPQTEYKFAFAAPVTESLCSATPQWNVSDPRGFAWSSGEYRCALYNHYYTPNSTSPDCIGVLMSGGLDARFSAYGWRAARSRHPGGVNVLTADGSLRFVDDEISRVVWREMATISGGERTGTP